MGSAFLSGSEMYSFASDHLGFLNATLACIFYVKYNISKTFTNVYIFELVANFFFGYV